MNFVSDVELADCIYSQEKHSFLSCKSLIHNLLTNKTIAIWKECTKYVKSN